MAPDPTPLPAPGRPLPVAAFFSHPTQHHAPWFRALAGRKDVALKVFYFSRQGDAASLDQEFGQIFQWDLPLLEGYESEFLPSLPGLSPTYHGRLRLNLGIRAALQSQPWDAVLNFSYSSLANWVVWRQARSLEIPQIYHSDSTLTSARAFWRQLLKELPVRRFFRGISIFLCSGDHNRRYLHRYGAPETAITPCPIPVDIRRFQKCKTAPDWSEKLQAVRAKYRIAEDDRVAVFCGKLIARKRPSDLAQAILKLNSPKVKGLFIGTGPLAESLQRLAPGKVMVTGFINQSEIPYYLGAADVLVMPSEIDPHPLAVTEAAGLGVPAIISDTCGCWGPHDILRPGENGLTYPCGDIEALAKNLKLLLFEQEDLRRRMSARALELAETQDVGVAAEAVVQALASYFQRRPRLPSLRGK